MVSTENMRRNMEIFKELRKSALSVTCMFAADALKAKVSGHLTLTFDA